MVQHNPDRCESPRVVQAYVRISVRSPVTHHKHQAWIPFGFVCLCCHATLWAPGDERHHRLLRESLGRPRRPTTYEPREEHTG